ncbi:MAG: phosphoribosylformylglycinamidine synthase II, partial [Limnothrix sp. RL_2_0]|nr:phosphoribosylformylglycinamidine synthase II [Limnothrix sp. RL_2_0]
SCIGGEIGATISMGSEGRLDEMLFGETCGKIVVSVAPENQATFEAHLKANLAGNWHKIGEVNDSNTLEIASLINVSVADMTTSWSEAIARRLHA